MGDTEPTADPKILRNNLGEASNVLLLVPSLHPANTDACMDLLSITDPENENVWSLGITLPPDKRVENWEQYVGKKPAAFKIVSIGEQPEAKAREVAKTYGFVPEPHFVTISDGAALTRIGVELMTALDDWEQSDAETVLCFHSLSALLQYTTERRVFQFLNTFTTQVKQADAFAHYHMDPEAHEESTVGRVKQLVDAVVEPDADGEYRVVTR